MLCLFISAVAQSQPPRALRRDTLNLYDTAQTNIRDQLQENIPVITLDENELKNEGQTTVASLLTAGRDPFYSVASFNFSAARFRIRGYDADAFAVFINGAPMNSLDNGAAAYSSWSGLTGVMRNRSLVLGLRANAYTPGMPGSTTVLDVRASQQQPQTSVTLGMANRNYTYSAAAAYASGLNNKGWAYTVAGSLRWANQGYIPGTFYHGASYLIGVDKKLEERHLFSLLLFGAPTENARAGATVAEMQQLAGSVYYNPYWGYQNGKVRSAAVAHTHRPTLILTHSYTLPEHTTLTTAISVSSGRSSSTGLDWYNAPDPRPDYYRYLPSYITDADQQQQVKTQMENQVNLRQINWQRMYDINRTATSAIYNANGITGNTVTGYRSHYILAEQVNQTRRLSLSSTLHTQVNERVEINAGISLQQQHSRYYEILNDLLGGDFYVDLNQYAERDFPGNTDAMQNDLRRPNRIVHNGDRFGYDYAMNISKAGGWAQATARYARVDVFVATGFSATAFSRTGYVTNGLFPYHSLGKSPVYSFSNYTITAGATYKINGRQYLYVNGSTFTRAPYYNNVFISPTTRNTTQAQVSAEQWLSGEAGYIVNAPKIKLRIGGYYTRSQNGLDVLSFYHDDYRNFVNYALSGIRKLYYGGELGIDARVLPNVNMNLAVAAGKYLYAGRQHATVTLDNSTAVLASETVYLQNYRIGGSPQQAVSVGFTYRSPDYWFIGLTANYMADQWLTVNPIRRTFSATEGLVYKNTQWHQVVDQQQLPAQYLLNGTAGYSWRLPRQWGFKKPVYLVFSAGASNLLNNRQMISGGYEQLRFDYTGKDIFKFPPKYIYAYGASYVINASLRF